jgi:hypothetical protein
MRMTKKQSFPVIAFGILIIALALLLMNSLATLRIPAISLGSHDTTELARDSAIEISAAASVARWEAMGEWYSGTSARPEAAANADQARWEAMGEWFSRTSARPEKADVADQARWDAMGAAYEVMADK